ncbi:MAG: glycosyltransferase family 2 protein [Candidatus Omnitrophota bacterium]
MNLSVVIPVYNEAKNIKTTIKEILSAAENITDIEKIHIIAVDDHSSDDTYNVINNLNDSRITCLRLSRRSGSHTALRAGLLEAKGDAVLCISGDGQDDPSCLKDILDRWERGVKIVWALRKSRKEEPWYIRKPAESFYKVISWMLANEGKGIDLCRADFFLLDRAIVDAICACPERNTSLFGLIAWLGFSQDFVEYNRRMRHSGRSKWSFKSRFGLAANWIIAFSGLPLKIASSVGILMSILGASGAVYVIIDKLFFSALITGWASIVILILLLGGIQLTMLGVIGEYLWRNLDESRNRPLFFIEKRSG